MRDAAMRFNLRQKEHPAPARPTAYRTLQGWALGLLLEEHAVRECPEHGHMRDRRDPEAWNRAREVARQHPFSETSAEASIAAIDDVLRSIGDTCPECD
jgi:hypothetical protein